MKPNKAVLILIRLNQWSRRLFQTSLLSRRANNVGTLSLFDGTGSFDASHLSAGSRHASSLSSPATPTSDSLICPGGLFMKLKSVVRVFCALAIGLLPGVAHAQHSTGQYVQVVSKASGTVTITSSVNPSAYTQSVTFTATVPTGAAGTVSFFDGGTLINTAVTIGTGATTVSTATSSLTVGTHSITATYSGDSNYTTATSAALSQVVGKGASGLVLTSAPNPSNFGSTVTFTASLATGATGNVTFYDGTTSLGTVAANAGTAPFPISTLTAGTHSITAQYAGDSNFNSLTSNIVSQVVNKNGAISPVLTSSLNPATYGASVMFTATMPSNATGLVTFFDGTTSIGTGTLNAAGVATFSTTILTAGTHSVTASYPGDSNYAASVSNAVSEVIKQQTGETITLTSSLNPAAFSTSVIFTATVPSGASGTVTFYDGTTSIGTGTVNAAGVATYATSTLSVGIHSITANYGGDTNYSTVTSTAVSQVISVGTATVAISGAPNPSNYGSSVLMTIIVTGQNGVIPTGSVTLMDGSTALGSALPLDTNGKATFSVSTLTAGSHTITATYSGDANYK
jgi:Bacterial Ig-like domain (group 3)